MTDLGTTPEIPAAQPQTARNRPRAIAERITRDILNGIYPTGAKLPTERELAAGFKTNRNVVREALKLLEAQGLVRIRQGSGIYVEEIQFSSSVQLFELLMISEDGTANAGFVRDALEFRGNMMRMLVRAAAVRRTEEELADILRLVVERRTCKNDPDRAEEISVAVYRRIAEASHNQVYQFLFNTTARSQRRIWRVIDLPALGFDSLQESLEHIVEGFIRKDATLAELMMIRHTEKVRNALGLPPADTEPPLLPSIDGAEA